MIKLFINNTEADYKEIQDLDFAVTARIRDFKKIASVEGLNLNNSANILPLPATKANKNILLSNKNKVLSFSIIVDSVQRFKGKCVYESENYINGQLRSFNLEVFGGNSDFIQQLNNLTLRDLDLGTETFDSTTIENSWSGTASTFKGIFAPCVYGTLDSGTVNSWRVEDFRFHVYFETILEGIADTLSITIDSDFRSRDIWTKSCFVNGVGGDWISTTQNDQTNTLTAAATQIQFTASVSGTYSAYLYIPSTGSGTLDHVEVVTSGGYSSGDFTYTSGQVLIRNLQSITLSGGDTITLKGESMLNTAENMPIGTVFRIFGGFEVVEGKDFYISSCLPNDPIISLFAAWVEMFNWCVHFNPITRTLKIEPMFDYKIGSTTYTGFYTSPNSSYHELDDDISNYSKSYKPIFDTLDFSYNQNKTCDDFIKGKVNSNLPIFGSRVNISDGTNIGEYGNRYFKRLYNGIVTGVNTGDRYYPILLDEDFKIKSSSNTIESPTFNYSPSFFFVSSLTTGFTFEGSVKTGIPIASQINLGSSEDFTMSWCDIDVDINGTITTKKGLLSIFYQKQFAIFRRFEILKTNILLDDIIHISTYKKAYKRDNEFYLLSQLLDVKLTTKLYQSELIKLVSERSTDSAETTHYSISDASQSIILIS